MTTSRSRVVPQAEQVPLGIWQLFWLAAAVFVVSAGYGALMPLLPRWLAPLMSGAGNAEIARHVGWLSGIYAAGVLVGAPLWGLVSDRVGYGRILTMGLVGYVTSLVLLLSPVASGIWGIYAMRGAAGFFVAAVIPIVPALVAAHTPRAQRARRFAWLSGVSLAGFLVGPGVIALAEALLRWSGQAPADAESLTQVVIALSVLLGALPMLGLALTLARHHAINSGKASPRAALKVMGVLPLWAMSGTVMFVLSGFELGIVLQAQWHADLSSRDVAWLFALCSIAMLLVNALLFFTSMLERVAPRILATVGLVLAVSGLMLLGQHQAQPWLYVGISMMAAGTGLVLPVVSYLAASTSRRMLGATMGGLAAAAGLGQTLGSSAGGWVFGAIGQASFSWLSIPLGGLMVVLMARPGWWLATPAHLPLVGAGRRSRH